MRIIVSNEITIEHPSQELKDWCKKTLVVKNPDFEKKFRMKLWLGDTPEKIWLYKVDGDSIILPFGVLTAILPMTEGANFETRFPKKRKIDYQCEVPLFDYQEPAVDALCEAKYGILQSKAGSGKTQMGNALIANLGVKTLWLTHTQDLLRQSFERAAQYMDSSLFGTITAGKVHIGKGITFATTLGLNRLTCQMQRYRRKHGMDGWIYKFDLKDYFGSTPHSVAFEAMSSRIDDDWVESEVLRLVKSFNQGADPNKGMGLGSEPTQLTQLAVLDDLDHYIKEQLHIRHYIRYMDDFILIHHDKEYLKYCGEKIRERIQAKGLRLSPKKTQLSPFRQPIHFLGFSFRITETGKVIKTLLPEKISHERRKLRKLVALSLAGVIPKSHVDKCYESWKAHAAQGNSHKLILEMDKYYKELWRKGYAQISQCSKAVDQRTP